MNMNTWQTYKKTISCGAVALIVLYLCIKMLTAVYLAGLPPEDGRVYEATVQAELLELSVKTKVWCGVLILFPVTVLVLTIAHTAITLRIRVKLASVHPFEVCGSKILVHERDLQMAAPIAMGIVNGEQLKQANAGLETALHLAGQIQTWQERQMKLLSTPVAAPALIAATEPEQNVKPMAIPTFAELVTQGALTFGQPMILGYANGEPRRGSFLDIYSAAVAGESGSGKTSTLLYLIANGLIAEGVRYEGIDPHYPHPKSLAYKLKPLWDAGLIRMATYYGDMLETLQRVETTIVRRLRQDDTDTTPVVLVIDELAFLSKTSIAQPLAHTMERISTEGRKCSVYMLASSQTWLVARTGDSSVVRDTLTSAFVHRIKPKQANLLLQDKEEAEKVKRYCKQAGDVLLCPVNDESVIVKIPYTDEHDMQHVAELLQPRRSQMAIHPTPRKAVMPPSQTELDDAFLQLVSRQKPVETIVKPVVSGENATSEKEQATHGHATQETDQKPARNQVVSALRALRESRPTNVTRNQWYAQIAEKIGVSPKHLINVMSGQKNMTPELETTVTTVLRNLKTCR